jgi:hypothetical protein
VSTTYSKSLPRLTGNPRLVVSREGIQGRALVRSPVRIPLPVGIQRDRLEVLHQPGIDGRGQRGPWRWTYAFNIRATRLDPLPDVILVVVRWYLLPVN